MQIPPESQQTPMIKQYLEIKKDYTDLQNAYYNQNEPERIRLYKKLKASHNNW